jgi:hypothetical protein
MYKIHPAHAKTSPASRQPKPLAWLQVRRGGTRYPLRPVYSTRFLIGSGTNCHLQLGGAIPLLHSLLTREVQGWTIEAVFPEPQLRINGVESRQCKLHPDDIIEIGPFEMQLVLPGPALRPLETACGRRAG